MNEKPEDQNDGGAEAPEQASDAAAEPVETADALIIEELRTQLEAAQQAVGKHQDALLRTQAEMENLRKRMARELEKAHKFALEKFMKALLPVRDSLERGLEAVRDCDSVDALKEGKTLTMKMLTKAMQDHGLEVIDPAGQAFNPEWHEAVSTQPSDEAEPDTVLTVIQKGYALNDRLIRPAMVVVARAPD